jgi:hypothetical protein
MMGDRGSSSPPLNYLRVERPRGPACVEVEGALLVVTPDALVEAVLPEALAVRPQRPEFQGEKDSPRCAFHPRGG